MHTLNVHTHTKYTNIYTYVHRRAATVAVKDFFSVMWVAYALIAVAFLWYVLHNTC